MSETTHEGWANRETWAANLWFANDEGLYRSVLDLAGEALDSVDVDDFAPFDSIEKAAAYQLERMLEDFYDELVDQAFGMGSAAGVEANEELKTMVRDIGSTWRIDYAELAAHWVTDAKESRS